VEKAAHTTRIQSNTHSREQVNRALENPNCISNVKSLASAVAKIVKRNSKILENSPSPGPCPLFYWCDFMMALGKPKLHAKFEVASLSCCRNIKEEPQNFTELP